MMRGDRKRKIKYLCLCVLMVFLFTGSVAYAYDEEQQDLDTEQIETADVNCVPCEVSLSTDKMEYIVYNTVVFQENMHYATSGFLIIEKDGQEIARAPLGECGPDTYLLNTVYEWSPSEAGVYEAYLHVSNEYGETESDRIFFTVYENPSVWESVDGRWRYRFSDGSYASGVVMEIGENTYSFDAQGYMEVGWKRKDGQWYYFEASGAMAKGWKAVNGTWYYLNENGVMLTNWQQINNNWYYLGSSGAMAKGWKMLNANWYYFTVYGNRVTGWNQIGGQWYYFDNEGIMLTGWQKINGKWYYMLDAGRMITGWKSIGGHWYYFSIYGDMTTGWQRVNNTWYYMEESGQMATGWKMIGDKWYYLTGSGAMSVGWQKVSGNWYYLDIYGVMVTGWQYIDGYKYYFYPGGARGDDLRNMVSGPYSLKVNRQQNCVTVYAKDGNNGYIIPVKAFLCSTGGSQTPLGSFTMSTQYRWHQLYGAYGQYCSRIVGHILFHSVPYYRNGDIYSLMPGQFNRLGTNASAGCVRLCTGDAKWIYDNCHTGLTQITIYDSVSPGPLGKPVLPKILYNQNWDPTDTAVFGY